MNNDIELPDPELTKIDPSLATDAKIGKEGKIVLIVIAAIFGLICLGALFCIGLGTLGIGSVAKENAPIKQVVDSFMQDMVANDFDRAYALFSPRGQELITTEDLNKLRSGVNAGTFHGYESVSINGINIQNEVNNTDGLQRTIAEISGKFSYESGMKVGFEATLEKVNGEWMLYWIDLWPDTSDSPYEDLSI